MRLQTRAKSYLACRSWAICLWFCNRWREVWWRKMWYLQNNLCKIYLIFACFGEQIYNSAVLTWQIKHWKAIKTNSNSTQDYELRWHKWPRVNKASHWLFHQISLNSPLYGQPAIYFLILIPWPHPARLFPAKESQWFSLTNSVELGFRSYPERNKKKSELSQDSTAAQKTSLLWCG